MAIRYHIGQRSLLVGMVAALLAVGGCGGANTPYPVRGTVTLDGQPATELAGGTVTFNSPELHRSASGSIGTDGTYRLTAVPGKYQVTVSPPEAPPAGERGRRAPTAKTVPFAQGQLEVTVERRGNDIPVALHRR